MGKRWRSNMGSCCSADKDGGVKPATSTNRAPVLHQPAPSEGAQDINRLPRSQPDSAALEGWRNVSHLQFHAFAAVVASTPVISSEDWHRRNALINCIALVCKDWWQAVAPAEGLVIDHRLQRRIRITQTVTAADMRPWWTIVQATSSNINDAVIIALAERCPALISVDVSYCRNLTDAAIIGLAERCPALTRVSVISCTKLTDAAIIGLAEHCPALTDVSVSSCRNLTDAAIVALVECCPALTRIDVMYCTNSQIDVTNALMLQTHSSTIRLIGACIRQHTFSV